MTEEKESEARIFEAAQKVFQRSGYSGARMQEIADEAGINKSMLHYYYRSKKKLFQAIFREGIRRFFPKIFEVLNSDLSIKPKITRLVETYYDIFESYPHLPRFIINEMYHHPEEFRKFIKSQGVHIPKKFAKQVNAEISAGNMIPIEVDQLIVNIVSLIVFPVIAKPMEQEVFGMDDEQFQQFIHRRRETLPGFILNALNL